MKRCIIIFICMLSLNQALNAADEFPARRLYLAIPYIELDAAYKRHNQAVFVDVHSSHEYQPLCIKDAINIPLADKNIINKYLQQAKKEKQDTTCL